MEEKDLWLLSYSQLSNKHKSRIIDLLLRHDEMNISEIKIELGISYKETYRYIQELAKSEFLMKEKKEEGKGNVGKPVVVKFNEKGVENIIKYLESKVFFNKVLKKLKGKNESKNKSGT